MYKWNFFYRHNLQPITFYTKNYSLNHFLWIIKIIYYEESIHLPKDIGHLYSLIVVYSGIINPFFCLEESIDVYPVLHIEYNSFLEDFKTYMLSDYYLLLGHLKLWELILQL